MKRNRGKWLKNKGKSGTGISISINEKHTSIDCINCASKVKDLNKHVLTFGKENNMYFYNSISIVY